MNTEIETAIKEYYELNKKIKEIEKRRSELKEVLYSALNSEHTNELKTEDILFYRVNRPRISWDESILKSILLPKGLWDLVLSVDTKRVRDLIETQVLSWQEIEKAKATVDIWYTYAERVSKNQEIKPSIYLIPDEEIKGIKRLVITDLSRMKEGRVCIFGFDEDRRHIRPVIPYTGINESYIFNEEGQRIIKPFAEVEFDFIRTMPEPPHTEDCVINTNYKPRLIRNLSENESKKFLEEILDESINTIFGAAIQDNRYIKTGGNRSIGTIKVKEVLSVNYFIKENDKYNYRMTFSDMSGDVYNLPITDCAFRKYCDNQRIQKGKTTDVISHELQRILNQSEVFLRVGLTRLYKDVYWLQVSGVHTFPDYREKDHEKRVSEPFDKQSKDTSEDIDFKNTVSVLLNDFSGSKRAHAAYLLGESRNPMVVEILCNATKDSDVNVRRLAASALGKIRDNRATDALIGLLYDHNPQVRQYAVKALGEIGDERALPELMKFEDDAIPYIKKTIDTAIEKIKKSRADLDPINAQNENFDPDLFEILRCLRKELADKEGISPFIIFYDISLKAMATYFPKDLQTLGNIEGVDETNLRKYGELFLTEIVDYCIEHKIESEQVNTNYESDKTLLSIPSDSIENKVEPFDIQDNSCSEINKIDGTIIVQKIISCVSQIGESFGMRHIADVLCGSKSKKVIYNCHENLTIYGTGKEYSREQWQDFIKELIQLGYLKSEGEIYPVIKQTQKSRNILSGKERIFLTKPAEEVHIFDENFDRDLFEILRILRKKLADEESIPPYITFHDSSLKAMATHFPQNPSDFQKISGVGERKLMKYSKLFLGEIISYCKKHKIEPKAINALGYAPKTTTSTLQTPTSSKTERLGVDIVRVGMSKRDRIETLKQIIREFQHDKEAAPLEDIISKAESSGIESDAVEDVIRLLKRTGEIYEVSNERFRIA